MENIEQSIRSLKAVYQRQHVALATARTKLIEGLTYKQYQAARVNGFFQVERVAKISRSCKLRQLASEIIYMQDQLSQTGRELDEVLNELEK